MILHAAKRIWSRAYLEDRGDKESLLDNKGDKDKAI